MFKKTSNTAFLKYGDVYDHTVSLHDKSNVMSLTLELNKKSIDYLVNFEEEVYIELLHGLGLIVVSSSPTSNKINTFAIHHHIKIKPNVPFNIIPLSESVSFMLYHQKKVASELITIPTFTYQAVKSTLMVKEILGNYYVLKGPNYKFKGEAHEFFELTYVDSGSLDTTIEETTYTINSSELIFYTPGQFHTQQVVTHKSCSYITIIFDLTFDNTDLLKNKIFKCSEEVHRLLKLFLNASHSEMPYSNAVLVSYLQQIIVLLIQSQFAQEQKPNKMLNTSSQFIKHEILAQVIHYMEKHIYEPTTIEEICCEFSLSRSTLQSLFKTHLNTTPKHYFLTLKLEKSKQLICEEHYSLSEIAFKLGFGSIHYFSRIFKQHYDLSPSSYAKQIYKN